MSERRFLSPFHQKATTLASTVFFNKRIAEEEGSGKKLVVHNRSRSGQFRVTGSYFSCGILSIKTRQQTP